MKKLLMGAALLLGTAASAQGLLINGAGATFPAPLYQKWFSEYNKLHPDIKFNYQAIGSGGGIKQFTEAHSRLRRERRADEGRADRQGARTWCTSRPSSGAVVVAYNVPGVPSIRSRARRWQTSSSGRSPSGTIPRSPPTTPA